MDIIVDPFYPPLWIGIITLAVVGFVAYRERSLFSRLLLGVLVVLLGVIAFKPVLITRTPVPPTAPVQVVYENNPEQLRRGSRSRAKSIGNRLKQNLEGSRVEVLPLDGRWDKPPVFRDYHQLARRPTGAPLRVVVGRGTHTKPGVTPDLSSSQSRYRAVLRVPAVSDTAVPYLRVENPVVGRTTPGSVRWQFTVRNADRLSEPVLRIRKGGDGVITRPVAEEENVSFAVESPSRDRGVHYFVAELLEQSDTALPVGHPRRTGLGISVSRDRRTVLISSPYPGWASGWWGRQVNEFGQWETRYRFRKLEREVGKAPTSKPEVVVYVGFPGSAGALDQFRSYRSAATRLLWIPRHPSQTSRVASAMKALGLTSKSPPVKRQGQFQPSLTSDAEESFPALARYDYVMPASPPFRQLIVNIISGSGYETVLQAGSSPLLSIDPDRGVGVLTASDFHRWAMTWGRLNRPKTGGELAREIIGKMMRMGERRRGRHLRATWARAGQAVEVRDVGDTASLFVSSGEVSPHPVSLRNGRLTFPRPGRYTVAPAAADPAWREKIVVVEPEEERLPGGGLSVRGLATEETTFDSSTKLIGWAEDVWSERVKKKRRRVIGWNNLSVLLLLVGLLTGAWFSRDRGGQLW